MRGPALLAAALLVASPAWADPSEAYSRSPGGRRFRVGFDPVSRVTVGLAAAVERGPSGAPKPVPEIDVGIGYRYQSCSGKGRERVAWQIDHRVVAGWVQPLARPAPKVPALDAALYGISALRHDESPRMVLPTSPPVGVPFPFDIGLEAEAGRVTIPLLAAPSRAPAGSATPRIHVGVLRASLLLDPWRSGAPGRSFEIGIGARYDVDLDGAPGSSTPRIIHRVAPMTAGSLRFRFQSADGLAVADLRGEVAPHWSSEGAWALSARTSVHLERALIAVNDQPIAAMLDGGYRYAPGTQRAEPLSDFRVSLGLSVNLQIK